MRCETYSHDPEDLQSIPPMKLTSSPRSKRPTIAMLVCLGFFVALPCTAFGRDGAKAPRPKLQIINGSTQPLDVFWLKTESERVPNGSVAPGKDLVIATTLGHRFEIVGREDQARATVASEVLVQAFRFQPDGKDGVPPFYTKSASAGGYPIVASARVNDYALAEAAYLVDMMLAKRPDLREAMIKSGSRLCILASTEFTTDLPEFAQFGEEPMPAFPGLSGKEYWDARARGTGGCETDPYCSCGEENLLGYPGDPYAAECILIHEFAHNIHLRGLANVDPTFGRRLKETYDKAMAQGLWKGKYAGVNHHEYFAEGVQTWFDNNRCNDHDHNHVHTRRQLLEYDPGLAAICREVFGDTALTYTKPATRLSGHMAGYDPSKAPTFAWPERLHEAQNQIRAAARNRDRRANAYETREMSGWKVHVSRALREQDGPATRHALELLEAQLDEIVRVVPKEAVAKLRTVPLWLSPTYPGVRPTAEYHPDAGWLREHGRDPAMARCVEFTNVEIFEKETHRMPVFVLHELAHAYHDQVLGFENPEIENAYREAMDAKRYDSVRRSNGATVKAYAATNAKEYFAETTEAFFGRNDFYPFTRDELNEHDPAMHELLERLWGVNDAPVGGGLEREALSR